MMSLEDENYPRSISSNPIGPIPHEDFEIVIDCRSQHASLVSKMDLFWLFSLVATIPSV